MEALLETDDPDGSRTLWVATNGGLARRGHGQWSIFNRHSGLPNDVVRSLHVTRTSDGRPTLWVGTRAGLSWTDPDVGRSHGARWTTPQVPRFPMR